MRVSGCEVARLVHDGLVHEKVWSRVLLRVIWMFLYIGSLGIVHRDDFHKWRVMLGAVLAPPRVEWCGL